MSQRVCALLAGLAYLLLSIWGFVDALKKQQASESRDDYFTRVLRGLSLVMLAIFVAGVGGGLCAGLVSYLG